MTTTRLLYVYIFGRYNPRDRQERTEDAVLLWAARTPQDGRPTCVVAMGHHSEKYVSCIQLHILPFPYNQFPCTTIPRHYSLPHRVQEKVSRDSPILLLFWCQAQRPHFDPLFPPPLAVCLTRTSQHASSSSPLQRQAWRPIQGQPPRLFSPV